MDRVWLEHYPAGVPADVDPDAYSSLAAMFAQAAERFDARPACGNLGTCLSYAELDRKAQALAAFLQTECALAKGDRVALMMPNLLQYPIAMLATLRAGGVCVNTNPLYTAPELRHQLADSGARILFVFERMLPVVAAVLGDTPVEHVITLRAGDCFRFPKSLLVNWVAHRRDPPRPALAVATRSFPQALGRGADCTFHAPELVPTDLAFLQYTGGTTGVAKGAMLSHRNVLANIQQVTAWFGDAAGDEPEVVLTALPLYHIYALTVNCFSFLHQGGLVYLITDPRDLKRLVAELRRVPITTLTGVNTLFNALLQRPDFRALDFARLRYTSGGGMAVQRSVAEEWERVTGSVISEGYGLTEASPVVCINPYDAAEFSGCIGLPAPSTECRIVDDAGNPQPPGESGELWVRGPQVMQGYWRRPDETARVLSADGWLKTGDIALMREDGYFKIVDRKKDMIVVSGFNVYPNEVEQVAAAHSGVLEAAVIGIPDPRTTEAVKLVVVRSDPTLTVDALLEHCRKSLTGYKVPRTVEFVDALPKTNVGKILRREVRERFGAPSDPDADAI